nr:glyoxylate/hydroxypyruvate reductase A [Burkholderia anthina]
MRQLPNLRWVQSLWAGVERLVADLPDARFAIVRLVDPQLAAIMAEAVLAWTLYLHRDMPAYTAQQRRHEWTVRPYRRSHDVTVGILGIGELGEPSARRLLDAGFKVRGWSRSVKALDGIETFAGVEGLPAMLGGCDIVVCLLPLTPQTTGLLDARRLGCLPKGAAVINFSRGPVIDDQALRDALDAGQLRHAVLDVFNQEPLPAASWHWDHAGVTVLPHISGPNDRSTAAKIVADNLKAFRETGIVPAAVDRTRGY